MARFDLTARRALGQHFVCDPATVRRIAMLSGVGPGDHVVEIGAGLGSLTLALAETGASVLAVEVDASLVAALRHVLAGAARVRVVEGDARTLDFTDLLRSAGRWRLAANLPYNIATPLVLDLLRRVSAIKAMAVMLQTEPARRLAAPPGSRSRGIPSVMLERYATARVVAEVPPSVFVPLPKVDSAIVRIDRRESPWPRPNYADDRFERIVRAAFGQRRKMLRRSLAGRVAPGAFVEAGVNPETRPEELTLRQWTVLAAVSAESSGGAV